MLGDEARLRLAEERLPVLDEERPVRLGGERCLGRLDAVEPDLADAVPGRLRGRPLLDEAEAETAEPGQLPHDVRMRPQPVGAERLTGEIGMPPDEADSLDHDPPKPIPPDTEEET